MSRLTSEELVNLLGQEQNAEVVAKAFDKFVNNMSMDKEGFITALKNADNDTKTKFTLISFLWLQKMKFYYVRGHYDLRNQYSVETSNQILNLISGDFARIQKEANLLEEYPAYEGYVSSDSFLDEIFEVMVVEKLGMLHKTLQQSFSELVFRWLITIKDTVQNEYFVELSQLIDAGTDEYFYRTPFI